LSLIAADLLIAKSYTMKANLSGNLLHDVCLISMGTTRVD
jgi:hypothetical protein